MCVVCMVPIVEDTRLQSWIVIRLLVLMFSCLDVLSVFNRCFDEHFLNHATHKITLEQINKLVD